MPRRWIANLLRRPAVRYALLGLLVAVMAGLSLLGAWNSYRAESAARNRLIDRHVSEIRNTINDPMVDYSQALRAAAGLFHTTSPVDREVWNRFADTLDLRAAYPGIQGIGFARFLTAGEVADFERRVRSDGFPDFRVHPREPARADFTAIEYLSPLDERNRRALGYDMRSEPTRAKAMQAAWASGEPALSGPVTLRQELNRNTQAGTLLYLPVYADGADSKGADQTLTGFVYGVFRMGDLFQTLLVRRLEDFHVQVFDQSGSLLFDSLPHDAPTNTVSRATTVTVGGREWRVTIRPLPAFGRGLTGAYWLVLVAGLLMTGLVFSTLWNLLRSERRAFDAAGKLSRAYADSEKRQRAIVEATVDGIITVGEHNRITSFSAGAERIFDRPAQTMLGADMITLFPPAEHDRILAIARDFFAGGGPEGGALRFEADAVDAHGRIFPVSIAVNAMNTGEGMQAVALVADISERRKAEARIQHLALHDSLTGLANRRRMQEQLEQAVRQAGESDSQLAVMMIDLNRLKRINDARGHHAGDALLRRVGGRLRQAIADKDFVARMGGDEFVVLVPDAQDATRVGKLADELLSLISQPMIIDGERLYPRASLGIAMYPEHGRDPETLLRHADAAMYNAKRDKADSHVWFSQAQADDDPDTLRLETDLREALSAGDQLFLRFQPQFRLSTASLIGFEALVRWQHPVRGELSPADFIDLAEDAGLMTALGDAVVNLACREFARLRTEVGLDLPVGVNISPRELVAERFVERIAGCLDQYGLPSSMLTLEITENVLIESPTIAAEALARLRRRGIRIAIDDFGTGYASLSYLNRFPVDVLKIDKQFVRDILLDRNDCAIVNAIIGMAHNLELEVVAEGVETAEQMSLLKSLGCDTLQGYLLGRPMLGSDIAAFLRTAERISSQIEAA
ncbi:EAL domain-containing protein [Salinisphaera sp. P385]|uniref:EAL domain-containing protein n=1 Tax=Spectribacter acetivorans TaxID=3075603 RepID=A0ABU3B3J3_9GAMM|nr:EAL domain-containing protein [Salinisphaera sp. P385]MDT0617035.1 EAL domain-containing protein [Salinisphaera sp. P385]